MESCGWSFRVGEVCSSLHGRTSLTDERKESLKPGRPNTSLPSTLFVQGKQNTEENESLPISSSPKTTKLANPSPSVSELPLWCCQSSNLFLFSLFLDPIVDNFLITVADNFLVSYLVYSPALSRQSWLIQLHLASHSPLSQAVFHSVAANKTLSFNVFVLAFTYRQCVIYWAFFLVWRAGNSL